MIHSKLIPLIQQMAATYVQYWRGQIPLSDFYQVFRRPDAVAVQIAFLLIYPIILTVLGKLPVWLLFGIIVDFVYAGVLISKAKNMKQHMLYALFWAISSFLVILGGVFFYYSHFSSTELYF